MGSGSTWQEIILDDSADLWISLSDIKDYFYECAIPFELSCYFGLPDAPAWLVDKLGGDATQGCTPFLTVLPMGWKWSFFFLHK